ncbi:hypothetical protein PAL_GLEAN10024105 [Pteropus alecto]|uniref:Uncharacterized protein n=1 Tax=Pteropus alecto TaxID=9402 RepID=L5JY51_PTEAL|nr:hypothetical protein PAL_GLEAN10024105 [Pteropus alecto]
MIKVGLRARDAHSASTAPPAHLSSQASRPRSPPELKGRQGCLLASVGEEARSANAVNDWREGPATRRAEEEVPGWGREAVALAGGGRRADQSPRGPRTRCRSSGRATWFT